MYGADWIKYYSDRREHFEEDGRLRSSVNFTDEEAKAIVEEAHRLGKKVAAHAVGSDGIAAALRAGVDTIEHGDGLTDQLMDEMVHRNVYWVPTLTVDHSSSMLLRALQLLFSLPGLRIALVQLNRHFAALQRMDSF